MGLDDRRPCLCTPECKATTTRKMAPGHDMKLLGYLRFWLIAGKSADWARAEALRRGASAGLMHRLEITIRRGGYE